MLKKDFDILLSKFYSMLFDRYILFIIGRAYGQLNAKDFEKDTDFLQIEFLEYIQIANKRRYPNQEIFLPGCISKNAFLEIISNIKTKLL